MQSYISKQAYDIAVGVILAATFVAAIVFPLSKISL